MRVPALLLFVALGVLPFAPRTARADEEPYDLPKATEMLVVGRVSRGGRVAVFQDAVEARLIAGTWNTPEDGDTIGLPGGPEQTWTKIGRDDAGWFQAAQLRGGYGVATVHSLKDRIYLMHARGHRHVYVNGEPRVGDVYNAGNVIIPVFLKRGPNELLFKGGRGRIKVDFQTADTVLVLDATDRTAPILRRGVRGKSLVGVMAQNASLYWRTITAGGRYHTLPPLGSRKIPIEVETHPTEAGEYTVSTVVTDQDGTEVSVELPFKVVEPGEHYLHSFLSEIDGSVQVMGIAPWAKPEGTDAKPALFLSCHGASVPPMNQARAYKPKDWGVVVCPTNRRPYGFDWEDWGRLDALEVLDEARRLFDPDPARIYLTGHSMGGHGTWSLGAYFPDKFAAIGPSAGWRDFWSYGGGVEWENPTPTQQMLLRASNVSRTLLMEPNYSHHGVYVLHGDKDDNVPVSQARFMRDRLSKFHRNFAYYEQPGAGHWWGNRCVDWPPMFDFFKHNTIPEWHTQKRVRFVTTTPAINDRCYWVRIVRQRKWLEPSEVDVTLDAGKRRIEAKLENVQVLEFDLTEFTKERTRKRKAEIETYVELESGAPITVKLGKRTLENVPWPEAGVLRFEWDATKRAWTNAATWDATLKEPQCAGPFKEAFRNRFVLVVGTQGTPAENAWALQKARYDAETFWYRGNGAPEVMRDIDLAKRYTSGRNLILYGNADTNAAWSSALDSGAVDVRRGRVTIGDESIEADDLGVVMVRRHKDGVFTSVGIVSGTGVLGMRVTTQMPFFLSGAGFPDWMVVGADMAERGSDAIRGAGFFESDWSVGTSSAWSDR